MALWTGRGAPVSVNFTYEGLPVLERPLICSTREFSIWKPDADYGSVVCHSVETLGQMLIAHVLWHDFRHNCPTWTDAAECRCDVEGVGMR